jgi:hypothetical protein
MSFIKSSRGKLQVDPFDKKQIIKTILDTVHTAYPTWKFYDFSNGKPCDVMLVIPVLKIVQVRVNSFMPYEKQEQQHFQKLIIIDVIADNVSIEPAKTEQWEGYCHKHFIVSNAAIALERLKIIHESL